MASIEAPHDRNGFKIAIICALPLEAEMVELVLDKDWQDENVTYGKAPRDSNAYTTGVIGNHNVVLAYMPGVGSNSAATVASGVRSSFPEVEIAFVVGVCGVVPNHPQTDEEIILGDCVISTTIVQYDFGREYPLGFKRKNDIEDSIGRANSEIRAYISKLTTRRNRRDLTNRLLGHLQTIQQTEEDIQRPHSSRDRLFKSNYIHGHHVGGETCNKCLPNFGTCTKDCDALGCHELFLVRRKRLEEAEQPQTPRVHFGRFGTANTVMKSGEKRDKINAEDDITAFEMEGSGVWDTLPTILVKAACDYADSHKTKEWQPYAAASAAACLKAILDRWEAPTQSLSAGMAGMSLQNNTPPALPPRQASNAAGPSSSSQSQQTLGTAAMEQRTVNASPRPGVFIPPAPSAEDFAAMNRELIDAASKGNLTRVKELHEAGADLNARVTGALEPTPLHAAAKTWQYNYRMWHDPAIFKTAYHSYRPMMESCFEIINYLLVNGADWAALEPGPLKNALSQELAKQAQHS